MKKYFVTAVLLAAGIIFLPGKAAAQYNITSGYNSTYYAIEAAKARRRADSVRGHRSAKRRAVRRRHARRNYRRVSSLGNFEVPKVRIERVPPKSVVI